MRGYVGSLLGCLVVLASALAPAGQAVGVAAARPVAASAPRAMSSSSLLFVQNEGQWTGLARYQAWLGANETLWVGDNSLWLTLLPPVSMPKRPTPCLRPGLCPLPPTKLGPAAPRIGVNIRISFPGSNAHPTLLPLDRQGTHVSYFIGNKPSQWHADVPVWGGVAMAGLYPGVDLVLRAGPLGWQPTVVAREAASLRAVRMRINGGSLATLTGTSVRVGTARGTLSAPLLTLARPGAADRADGCRGGLGDRGAVRGAQRRPTDDAGHQPARTVGHVPGRGGTDRVAFSLAGTAACT